MRWMSSHAQNYPCEYDARIEQAIGAITALLSDSYRLTTRAIALLLLQGEAEVTRLVKDTERGRYGEIAKAVDEARRDEEIDIAIAIQRRDAVKVITAVSTTLPVASGPSISEQLGRLCMSPVT